MLCTTGVTLIRDYQEAARERAGVRDALLLVPHPDSESEDRLFSSKQRYSKAFVAWVTHRALCVSCRSVYGRNDQVQFASL